MRTSFSKTRPDDPAVVGRQRGAVDKSGGKGELLSTVTMPGRPQLPRGPPSLGAYSIAEFCAAHSISESFYHKLKSKGRAPTVMRVGTRTLITVEAAARWRAEREAETVEAGASSATTSPAPTI